MSNCNTYYFITTSGDEDDGLCERAILPKSCAYSGLFIYFVLTVSHNVPKKK